MSYRDPLPGFDYTGQAFARMLGIAPPGSETDAAAPSVTPEPHCAATDACFYPPGGLAGLIRRYWQLEQVGSAVEVEINAWFADCRARELEQSREEGL